MSELVTTRVDAADQRDDRGIMAVAVAADERGESIIAAARVLAAALDLEPRFVHVVAPASMPGTGPDVGPRFLPDLTAADRLSLEAGRATLWALGVEATEAIVRVGEPVAELLRVVIEQRAELLVMGSGGRGELGAALLGSVSRCLIREAPCPVAVVPPGVEPAWDGTSVVCGVSVDVELAARAAAVADDLAVALERRVVLGHVRSDRRAPSRDGRDGVECAQAQVDAPVTELRLLVGDPADQLEQLADEVNADVLVVATRGRGPLQSALRPSVAAALSRTARRIVVIVPPGSL